MINLLEVSDENDKLYGFCCLQGVLTYQKTLYSQVMCMDVVYILQVEVHYQLIRVFP